MNGPFISEGLTKLVSLCVDTILRVLSHVLPSISDDRRGSRSARPTFDRVKCGMDDYQKKISCMLRKTTCCSIEQSNHKSISHASFAGSVAFCPVVILQDKSSSLPRLNIIDDSCQSKRMSMHSAATGPRF